MKPNAHYAPDNPNYRPGTEGEHIHGWYLPSCRYTLSIGKLARHIKWCQAHNESSPQVHNSTKCFRTSQEVITDKAATSFLKHVWVIQTFKVQEKPIFKLSKTQLNKINTGSMMNDAENITTKHVLDAEKTKMGEVHHDHHKSKLLISESRLHCTGGTITIQICITSCLCQHPQFVVE